MRRSRKYGRRTGHPLRQIFDEAEAPRQRSLVPVNLVIHQVARADKGRHQSHRHHQTVERKEHAAMRHPARVNPDGYENTDCTAMTGQTAFPDFQNLDRVLRIEVPFIKQAMPQPRPDDHSHHHIDKERIEPLHIQLLVAIHAVHQAIPYDETNREKEPVPTKLNNPVEQCRVGSPSDKISNHNLRKKQCPARANTQTGTKIHICRRKRESSAPILSSHHTNRRTSSSRSP